MKKDEDRNMTIRELAARCNLSISSVSRAMNNPPETAQMTQETYKRVHDIAEKFGYRPNFYAKAFFKKTSNCIGFIHGTALNYVGVPLLEGLSDVFDRHDMTVALSSTHDEVARETEAFDRMFYRNVDAIIYLPAIRKGKYTIGHLKKLWKDNPEHPPVLSLLGGVMVPGMFQLCMKDAEASREAALRQLQLGCRKFGIVNSPFTSPAGDSAIEAYRNTLLKNGIPSQEINEVRIWHTFPHEKLELLRDIDGLWVIDHLLIPECHHALSRLCDLKKLHIDTVSTIENETLLQWLQVDMNFTRSITEHYGSLNIFHYSSYQIGAKAAEMIMKIIEQPSSAPYSCELDWNQSDFISQENKSSRYCYCKS